MMRRVPCCEPLSPDSRRHSPFPSLPASRLYAMARERGFEGGESHFRSRIAELRPKPIPEVYLRLKTLPGEQGQVD